MEIANSSQGKNAQGIFFLVATTVVGGLAIGLGVYIVSKFVYLVLLFPIIMGAIGGALVAKTITKYKIRKPTAGILFGLLMGLVVYGVYHYASYMSFRIETGRHFDQQLIEEYGQSDREFANQLVDIALNDETGYQGILGYFVLMAQKGLSVGRIFGGKYFNIGTLNTYVYWIVELVIIASVAADMGKKAASRPYCHACGEWYDGIEHIGATTITNRNEVIKYLRQNEFSRLGSLLQENVDAPSVDIYLQGCKKCQIDKSKLIVKLAAYDSKGKIQLKNISYVMITPSQRRELLTELGNAK